MLSKELEVKNIENENNYWSDDQEKILKEWSEKASCYKLMHDRAHKRFWSLNAWFSIPIIIFSTLTGTGNFAQDSFPENRRTQIIILIGTINLFSAILLSIKAFLNVAEKGEAYRLSSIDWDKLGRKIRVELSKQRIHRQECKSFIEICQEEYNRLIETQLSIPSDIIRWFIKLVETGEYDYNKGSCSICIYDWFCFPCGIPMCEFKCYKKLSSFCCSNSEKKKIIKDNKIILNEIELPEIVGKIKPTFIAKENTQNDNDYRVYSNNDTII